VKEGGTPVALHMSDVRRRRGEGSGAFHLDVRSFSVRRGQAVAVTGPSGCGKSTLLDLAGLVLKPDSMGDFLFHPKDEAAINLGQIWHGGIERHLSAIRARHLGYILQTGGILPFLTVSENIRLSSRLLGGWDESLIAHLVDVLDIGHVLSKKPRALSIGERQRVCVARALAHRPSLILADEPTASLDPVNAENVMKLLMGLVEEMGVSAIIVSHDRALVKRFNLAEARVLPQSCDGGTHSALEMVS